MQCTLLRPSDLFTETASPTLAFARAQGSRADCVIAARRRPRRRDAAPPVSCAAAAFRSLSFVLRAPRRTVNAAPSGGGPHLWVCLDPSPRTPVVPFPPCCFGDCAECEIRRFNSEFGFPIGSFLPRFEMKRRFVGLRGWNLRFGTTHPALGVNLVRGLLLTTLIDFSTFIYFKILPLVL